jgi:COP9 signalosome complex subunit 1
LGDFYAAQGDIENALSNYYKLKENCSSPMNIIDMCFKIIKSYATNLRISNRICVNYIAKADKTPNISDNTIVCQIRCAYALVYLEEQKYTQAAHNFILASGDINNSFASVISASDVAIYGALCALATFDRCDIKNEVHFSLYFYYSGMIMNS